MSVSADTLMAGVSGIRGIADRDLDSMVIEAYTSAYAARCGDGSILLARDPRPSGPVLREAIIETLLGMGRTVVDLGIVPTPTLLLNTALLKAAGGIMITASHNPIEWNGLKFADPRGRFLAPETSLEIIAEVEILLAEGGDEAAMRSRSEKGAAVGKFREDMGAAGRHMELVAGARGVDTKAIEGAELAVVVDCGGGAASGIVPSFLEGCGVEVHPLYCDPDGTFPRPPEPLPPALVDLGREVVERGADLGVALDPDADRLALVGPDGEPMGEEVTLALAARRVLEVVEGPVVTNLSTSRMIDDVASGAGTALLRTPVGEINVANGMLAAGAIIGGEGNGGVIHRDVVTGRDGLTGSALILTALALSGLDLPGLRATVPSYAMLKSRYALPGGGAEELRRSLKELPARYPEAGADGRDGVRLDWADRWVHVRPSNTEPIVRIISEAPRREEARDLIEDIASTMDLNSE